METSNKEISFLNIPSDLQMEIKNLSIEFFEETYRGITHTGDLTQKDFLPTFEDLEQQKRIATARNSGKMGECIVRASVPKTLDECSVSLKPNCSCLRATKTLKKRFIQIAKGPTKLSRGYSHRDSATHISYYLYDYINNNPCGDFAIIEGANYKEFK